MSNRTSKNKRKRTRSRRTSRASRHRGGGLLAELAGVTGPVLPTVNRLPDEAAALNTVVLLDTPPTSQIGPTIIPGKDLEMVTRRHRGGRKRVRRKARKARGGTQRAGKKTMKGGSLARGPFQQTYDYIKGDAMRVYDALGGIATELKDLNVARDARRILPKWML